MTFPQKFLKSYIGPPPFHSYVDSSDSQGNVFENFMKRTARYVFELFQRAKRVGGGRVDRKQGISFSLSLVFRTLASFPACVWENRAHTDLEQREEESRRKKRGGKMSLAGKT